MRERSGQWLDDHYYYAICVRFEAERTLVFSLSAQIATLLAGLVDPPKPGSYQYSTSSYQALYGGSDFAFII